MISTTTNAMILANSVTMWLYEVGREMTSYFNKMSTTHWAVIASAAVVFGFLCLKGSNINR
ncbi:hypothetical protein [Stieleria varia]|uniref:Uncharacterized protein n=1 Tax=Stieleria varia TaxID=2528005 RepID=A0A5C6B6U7_9BACT|nr:hypothetical protein [Stieleria varia]TWU07793.1 hypothetical protein Pla52n_03680 [Stieleria varia]